jgi:hypothetical protein
MTVTTIAPRTTTERSRDAAFVFSTLYQQQVPRLQCPSVRPGSGLAVLAALILPREPRRN